MAVDLTHLLRKFRPNRDFEVDGARRMTHVPSLGIHAYLHTLFQAADAQVQQKFIDPLNLPEQVRAFYRTYNGADLFSDNFSLYGFFPENYLLDRLNKYYPYNILDINHEYVDDPRASDIFVIGSYGFDRSRVYVEKATGVIFCGTGSDLTRIRAIWPTFETWIQQEIARLCECFDECGNRLVELEELLPRCQ